VKRRPEKGTRTKGRLSTQSATARAKGSSYIEKQRVAHLFSKEEGRLVEKNLLHAQERDGKKENPDVA